MRWRNRKELEVDGFSKAKKYTKEELAGLCYNLDQCGFPHEEEEILPPDEFIAKYQKERLELNGKIDAVLGKIEKILQ